MWCVKALLTAEGQAGAVTGVRGHSLPWDIVDARSTLVHHRASNDGDWWILD
jgi:hypothetical protein